MLTLLAALAFLQDTDKAAASVVEKMRSTTATVEFKDTSLADFAKTLGQLLGTTVTVSRTVAKAEEISITGKYESMSVREIAKAALKGKGLTMTLRKGMVTIVEQREIDEQMSTRDYDVSFMVHPVTDYSPATIDPWKGTTAPSREMTDSERARALGWTEDERLEDEHFGATPQERRRSVLKEDILLGREGFLDAAPANVKVEFVGMGRTTMRVTHTAAGHKKLKFYLDLCRPR